MNRIACPCCGSSDWDFAADRCRECLLTGDEVSDGWGRGMPMRNRCFSCGGKTTEDMMHITEVMTLGGRSHSVTVCGGCSRTENGAASGGPCVSEVLGVAVSGETIGADGERLCASTNGGSGGVIWMSVGCQSEPIDAGDMLSLDKEGRVVEAIVRSAPEDARAIDAEVTLQDAPEGYTLELLGAGESFGNMTETVRRYEADIAKSIGLPRELLGDPNTGYPTTRLGRHPLAVVNAFIDWLNQPPPGWEVDAGPWGAAPACECGSEKCRLPHSTWCPAYPGGG